MDYNESELIEEIKKLYVSGQNGKQVAKILNISKHKCYQYIRKLGVGRNHSQAARKHALDEEFFSCIDSDAKAYILGFLFADGYIDKGDRGSRVVLGLQERDKPILEKIAQLLGSSAPLYPLSKTYDGKTFRGWRLSVSSRKMVSDLEKYGCISPKWNRIRLPELLSFLMPAFLRGYIDGDGHISIGKYNSRRVGITGNTAFISDIDKFLQRQLDIFGSISEHRSSKDVSVLIYSRWDDIVALLNFIYDNATIYLERKHLSYLKLKNLYLHSSFCREFSEERLESLYKECGNWSKVGEKIGLAENTILQHRNRLGYKIAEYDRGNNPRYSREYLESLKTEHKTWVKVSGLLGINYATLQYHLRKVDL